jgi:proprotein convertase subtilisin/kexin type 2
MKKNLILYFLFFLGFFFITCPKAKKEDNTGIALVAIAATSPTSVGSGAGLAPSDPKQYSRVITVNNTYTEIIGSSTNNLSTIDIGFSFDYLGKIHTRLTVSYGGVMLGNASSYDGLIRPWQTNSTSGTITYKIEGTKFILQFKDVRESSTSFVARYNYQLILDSSDSSIEFLYGSRSLTSTSSKPTVSGSIFISGSSVSAGMDGLTGKAPEEGKYAYGDFPPKGTSIKFAPKNATNEITDPLFPYQWHLSNKGQLGGLSGEDVNVTSVWTTNKGEGIKVAVVDDGMDINHEDLKDNIIEGKSKNYVDGSTDPSSEDANHGTAVAGVLAARDGNFLGSIGVAPRAGLVGYNILANGAPDASSLQAMVGNGDIQAFDISNNSWGAADGTGSFFASNSSWRDAIDAGITNGRSQKGAVYFWAAGNGAPRDNSNYDGMANYYGVIAVGAIGEDGKKANYSEEGANLWIVGHSQGTGNAITTTDNSFNESSGYNTTSKPSGTTDFYSDKYTNTFNGTSSATPLVAGVGALILKANPNLTWRDVRLVLAESARKVDSTDSGWETAGTKITSGSKYNFNHKYGFGAADAAEAVKLAATWTNVGAMVTYTTSTASVGTAIPDNNTTGVSNTINVSNSNINKIEYVAITVNINHAYVGDLVITLTSPNGSVSVLAKEARGCINTDTGSIIDCGNFHIDKTWRFGSARHLGEAANGNWVIKVSDRASADTGTFTSWSLTFYGRQ